MKEIHQLNKAFENRIRLGVVTLLSVERFLDFNEIKKELGATDGNLSTHIRKLEDLGYVLSEKKFIKNKPNTSYRLTDLGKKEFEKHVQALKKMLDI